MLLPSLLHLLTSERMVSIDVLNALEEVQSLYGYKVSFGFVDTCVLCNVLS